MKRIRTGCSIIQAVCWLSIVLFSVFGLTISAHAGLKDGLIAHYPFDGGPADAGPNGYHGIENNGVALTGDRWGKPGRAYAFDGSDDYITAGNFSLPQVFSLSMWINPDDTADGRMFFGKPAAGGNPLVLVGFSNGGYSVSIGTVSHAEGSKTTGWQHLAVVVEKSGTQFIRVLFYKNGRLLWSKNHFYPVKDTESEPIFMGAAWNGTSPVNYFSGKMDDVRLYDRILVQTEIELLFNPAQGLDINSDDDIDGEDLNVFSENFGQTRWYKDQDRDRYSDGSSRWGQNPPDPDYFSPAELISVSGDCDDLDAGINPGTTGMECPPFGACCYTAEENCVPVIRCEENISERVCANELNGTFYGAAQCTDLSTEQCPVGAEPRGACCVSQSDGGMAVRCVDARTRPQCTDMGGQWYADYFCTDLSDAQCPPTGTETGACCRPKISYVNESGVFPVQCLDSLTEYKCNLLQGGWFRERSCNALTEVECPTIPPVTGACCRTMLSGDGSTSYAVCDENLTSAECTALDGSFFGDHLCSDLSADECPIPTPTGACCHPKISYVNESGVFPVQCLDSLTEYKCNLLQGGWYQDQACGDLSESTCAPFGACCYTDGDGTDKCANWMLESNCDTLAGEFHADLTCAEAECGISPDPVGACCLTETGGDGSPVPVSCVDDRTQSQCNTLGGSWYQEDACADLTPEQCPPLPEKTGACCQTMVSQNGSTTAVCNDDVTETECADNSGSFFADRLCADLSAEECPVPVPTGACCHPKISYVNESGVFPVQCLNSLTDYKCQLLQGSWYQDLACADLSESTCAPFGACCYTDSEGLAKCANWILESNCDTLSGTFFADQPCTEVQDQCGTTPDPVGACCLSESGSDGSPVPVRCVDDRTQAQCRTLGGSWYDQAACRGLTAEQCPPTGACCYQTRDGSYTCAGSMTREGCGTLKNSSFNENLSCGNLPAKSPCYVEEGALGVCCLRTGGCQTETTLTQCSELRGTWKKGSTNCFDCIGI